MKTPWVLLGTVALTAMQCTQCTKAPNPITKANGNSIEGSVFLITNAGDLKPARYAKVRVWSGSHAINQIFMSGPGLQKTPKYESMCRSEVVEFANTEEGWISEGETDEMGNFSFNNLRPGSYTVEAFGHSGMNAAIWSSDVSLESVTSHVKMGKPKVSCFDPDHVVPF